MNVLLNKLYNFEKAVAKLQYGVQSYDGTDDLARDGLIQRFQFTFELAWKTLKALFESEGLTGLNSPRPNLREAYAARLINDEDQWLKMLKDRNSTSHLYDEAVAIRISHDIQSTYLAELEQLSRAIKERITLLDPNSGD